MKPKMPYEQQASAGTQNPRLAKRAKLLFGFGVLLFSVLLLRILLYQTVDYDRYQKKVIEQMTTEAKVAAARGNIYDVNGVLLATNVTTYRVFISPSSIAAAQVEHNQNSDGVVLDTLIAKNLSEILGEYKRRGAIGVGELTANLYTDDPLMENLFYHCAECDLPVTVHMTAHASGSYGIIDDIGLPRLERMLKKYPKLRILGHSACFWCEISSDVTEGMREDYPKGKVTPGRIVDLLREYPNLYCDLSAGSGFNAISRDEEFGYRFIEEFSDRLMYGSDISVAGETSLLAGWLDESYSKGCISYENYKKVCRGNAIRVFGLDIE